MTGSLPISACLIVKNEEKMLAGCLDSIKNIVREIIIVDTGSTDKTISIARDYGAKIFIQEWNDNFSQARNVSLSKATQPIILSIDADERLINPELLFDILSKSSENTGGWLINITSESVRENNQKDIFSANLVRLFLNHPGIRYNGIIHEQIHESILEHGFKIIETPLQIKHLGYDQAHILLNEKQERNLYLLNKAIMGGSNKSYDFFQRGKTLLALDRLVEAERDFDKSINLSPSESILPLALNYNALTKFRLNKKREALLLAEKSLKIHTNQKFAHFIIAEIFFSERNYSDAVTHYLSIDEIKDNNTNRNIIGDYVVPINILAFKIGSCFLELKDYNKSLTYFTAGNQLNPSDPNCLIGIANIYFKLGQWNNSKDYLLRALSLDKDNKNIQYFLSLVYNEIKKQVPTPQPINPILSKEKSNVKPLISLCMIVKNEEKMLPGCLESVRNIVDEIIIVDTGSTDRTNEIARQYNAKIFNFKWIDDFAAARNESIKNATGEWILYLDADERIEENSRKYLRNLIESTGSGIDGYVCTIESNHVQLDGSHEKHRGGYPRIFRNFGYPNIKFQGKVHEQIAPSIFALGKKIDFSDIIITHLGYDQTREVMEAKVKRNYKLLLEHVNQEPTNAYAWFQLGQTLAHMGLQKEAEGAIRFAINVGKLSAPIYASAASSLSHISGNKKNFDEALYWAEESLKAAPEQALALNLKAYSLLFLGRYDESEQCFNEVLNRLRLKKGVPQSGFDIQISEKVVYDGLELLRKKKLGIS